MSKKSETKTTNKPATPTVNQADLIAALEHLFVTEAWEIPDSAVEGKYARKIEQMEAQVKSLSSLMLQLTNKIEGKPVTAGRVDALAATKKGKK